MWVESIELKNIKSYTDLTVNLQRGVNFISGINGAGKTTLLECIGLALFNCKRENRFADYFIRSGEKEGTVRVTFHVDSACYEVERRISVSSARNSWKAFDVSAGSMQLRLSGENDMEAWLKSCMGVSAHLKLSRMFSDVIGVSQGMFAAPFLLPEGERKTHFNYILQVEHYKKSADRHRPVTDYLNRETALIEGKLQMLRGAQEALDLMLEDGKELETMTQEKRETQERLKEELDAAKRELSNVQAKARAIEANRNKAALAEKMRQAAMEKLQERKAELQRSEKAMQRITELEPRYLEYDKAEKELMQIAESEKEQRRLETEKRWAKEMYAALDNEMQARIKLEMKEADSKALENKDTGLKAREQTHEQLKEHFVCLQEIYMRLQKGFDMLGECRAAIEKHEADLSAVPALMERVAQLEGAHDRRDEAIKEQTALKTKIEQVQKDMERAKGGACPIMDKACPLVGSDLQDYLHAQEADLQQGLAEQENKVTAAEEAARELKKTGDALTALKGTQKNLKTDLDKREKIVARINERLQEFLSSPALRILNAEYADVAVPVLAPVHECDIQDDLLKLVGEYVQDVQERMKKTGETLLDERVAYTGRHGAAAADLSAAKQAVQEATGQVGNLFKTVPYAAGEVLLRMDKNELLQRLAKQIEEYNKKLIAYASLEEHGNAVRALKEELRPFYEQYMENKKSAESLEQSQMNVSNAAEEVTNANKRLDDLRETGKELAEGWDETLPERTQARADELSSGYYEGKSGLDALMGKLDEHKMKTNEQRERVEQSIALETGKTELQKAQELLGIICNRVLKRMGERVSKVYRSRLSTRATQLYTQVARQNAELVWGEDYDIELIDMQDGQRRARSFRQLSGGEQMTAALAVRLGLLTQLSEVSMVCFDEPTTNLDRQRRESLSEIIPRLTKNFEQVLVISHDDTFDSVTQHTIRLVREHPQPTALLDLQHV